MKCPHCLDNIYVEKGPYYAEGHVRFFNNTPGQQNFLQIGHDVDGFWWIEKFVCPSSTCRKIVLKVINCKAKQESPENRQGHSLIPMGEERNLLIHPKNSNRGPVPEGVPEATAKDYLEACAIIADSPQASATLSRKCLQSILRGNAGVNRPKLSLEIKDVLESNKLPPQIANWLTSINKFGNAAAHPLTIVPVEQEEAEMCLSVINMLLVHYYQQPAIFQKIIDDFDLKQAGTANNG